MFAGDIKQDSQALNRYTYALNNPLKFTDPTGNVPVQLEDSTNNYMIETSNYEVIKTSKILSGQKSAFDTGATAVQGSKSSFYGQGTGIDTNGGSGATLSGYHDRTVRFGKAPSDWLDPLPSKGKMGDRGPKRAGAHWLFGRGKDVEFHHESKLSERLAKAKGDYFWDRGRKPEIIKDAASNGSKLNEGEGYYYEYKGMSPEGYLYGGDHLLVISSGNNDAYSQVTHTVRGVVTKKDNQITVNARARFVIRDRYTFHGSGIKAIKGPFARKHCDYTHIVHMDKTFSGTIP